MRLRVAHQRVFRCDAEPEISALIRLVGVVDVLALQVKAIRVATLLVDTLLPGRVIVGARERIAVH